MKNLRPPLAYLVVVVGTVAVLIVYFAFAERALLAVGVAESQLKLVGTVVAVLLIFVAGVMIGIIEQKDD